MPVDEILAAIEATMGAARMIAGTTNVGALLDERPELVEFIARYHPHFERLRNRFLRRVMVPRVTLANASSTSRSRSFDPPWTPDRMAARR